MNGADLSKYFSPKIAFHRIFWKVKKSLTMESIIEAPNTVVGLILHVKSCLYRRKFDQVIALSNKIREMDAEEPMAWYFKGMAEWAADFDAYIQFLYLQCAQCTMDRINISTHSIHAHNCLKSEWERASKRCKQSRASKSVSAWAAWLVSKRASRRANKQADGWTTQ